MNHTQTIVTLILSLAALGGIVLGWVRWARPRIHRAQAEAVAIRDSIIGRDAIRDSITGREIAPALPGVGVRLEAQEHHLGKLAEAVASLAESHDRLEDHEHRITKLERASIEVIVSRGEAASAWRALQDEGDQADQA
ncbi:MAG: hypothetical protein EPO65_00700 [Dehalococcoidia bacterium]|nr:MAG: hypothetical protein EPO65_00700 [Dehalococcoidia bacterium]